MILARPNDHIRDDQKLLYNVKMAQFPQQPRLGERLSMQCQVTPPLRDASYSWYQDGQLKSTEESYTIPNLKREDLGSYRCTTKVIEVNMELDLSFQTFIDVPYSYGMVSFSRVNIYLYII